MFCGFVPPLLGCDSDVTITLPGFCLKFIMYNGMDMHKLKLLLGIVSILFRVVQPVAFRIRRGEPA